MILVRIDWEATEHDLRAQRAATSRYRLSAAFHRALGDQIAAGCDGTGACAGGPCVEAYAHRRMARRLEASAWLEDHDTFSLGPGPRS